MIANKLQDEEAMKVNNFGKKIFIVGKSSYKEEIWPKKITNNREK